MVQNNRSASMEACWAAIFLLALAIGSVSAIEIYTKSEMIVQNGTHVRLSCTFKSQEIILNSTSVAWTFIPETGGKIMKIFSYLIGKAFPVPESQFQDRIIWDGNINRNDGSIIITNINFKDNGTYYCDVSHPHDISWKPSKIHLSVVEQAIGSVPAIEIYTKSEMIVENGTDVRLSCTFKSNKIILSSTSVAWTFIPETGGKVMKIFSYLIGKAFPVPESQFQDRIIWDGNINRNDASIIITNINFKDNGTYYCDVSNPHDISWKPSEIHLSVVEQGSLSKRAGAIAGSVIGAVAGLMLIIGIVCCFKKKKRGQRNGYIGSAEYGSPTEQPLKSSAESDMEDSLNHSSVGPLQGPVIYAQLDHSGGKHSNKIYKSDSVVYSDIRKS